MKNAIYKVTHVGSNDASVEELRARWRKKDVELLFIAISKNEPLPEVFPRVSVDFCGRICELDDLRGMDFSGRKMTNSDLSYCDLSHSSFNESKLHGVHFQYSVISFADFRLSEMVEIQASPVDAKNADFSSCRMRDCFFLHSNFEGARFISSEIAGCDFSETNIDASVSSPDASEKKELQIRKKTAVTRGYYRHYVFDQVKKVVGPVKLATVTSSQAGGQRYIVAVVDSGGFEVRIRADDSSSFFREGDVVKVQKVISGRKGYGSPVVTLRYRHSAEKKKKQKALMSEWKIIGLQSDILDVPTKS